MSGAPPPRFAEVVLPLPVPRPYTYEVPAPLAARAVPGARVMVAVQRRKLVALVSAVDVAPPAPPVAARPILDAPDASTCSGQRDRILFALLYNTGARVSEVL